MKTLLAVCIAALGLSAASMEPLKVTLAAPVIAGGVEFVPGAWTIRTLSKNGENVVLAIRSSAGESTNVLVNRITGKQHNGSGIVLDLRNGRYALDEVWLNQDEGFQVLRKAE